MFEIGTIFCPVSVNGSLLFRESIEARLGPHFKHAQVRPRTATIHNKRGPPRPLRNATTLHTLRQQSERCAAFRIPRGNVTMLGSLLTFPRDPPPRQTHPHRHTPYRRAQTCDNIHCDTAKQDRWYLNNAAAARLRVRKMCHEPGCSV